MPYCGNCGAQVREDSRFCETCGKPVGQAAAVATAPTPEAPGTIQPAAAPAPNIKTAKALLGAAMGLYAFAVPVGAMVGGAVGLVLALLALVVIYVAAFDPLNKGKLGSARTGTLISAGVSLLFVLLNLVTGDGGAAFFNLLALVALGVAWLQIRE